MTPYDNAHRHRTPDGETQEQTVRHRGSAYATLYEWAQKHQIIEIFEVATLTFGFTKHFTVIGNLCQELSHPESLDILNAWADNPLITQLSKLRATYDSCPDIHKIYPALPHAGNANQTKKKLRDLHANIEKRHFLLCLIVNPLASGCSEEQYRLRRAFRIWLLIQALERAITKQCLSDKRVQKVASFFTQNAHHYNWQIIDKTLERAKRLIALQPFTLDRFTLALRNAANELQVQSQDASTQRFLNSLIQVSEGNCEPNELEEGSLPFFKGLPGHVNQNQLQRAQTLDDFSFQHFDSFHEQEEDVDEASESALLYAVDPKDTTERQRLTGQSILLQTAELSHYLPWSWHKALPPEITLLNTWLDKTLVSHNALDRLGAALVWLATRLSRSLPFVLELSISSSPEEEWALSPDFALVHRQSPRRHSSWKPTDGTLQHIEYFDSNLALQLPQPLQQALHAADSDINRAAHSLHDLWYQHFDETPETWFGSHTKDFAPRLTSGMLLNIHPQTIVNQTSDHSFARLSSAHPRAALPAACGYANWDIKAVESGFNLPLKGATEADGARVNVLGSLLAPLDTLLIDQISQATETLNQVKADNLITYHNALARYCVMALYAATGCRHLSDPFESVTHFCADPPSVFINDKADDGLHNGRLVPLPHTAFQLIAAYQTHLEHLAKAIESMRPDLAADIGQLREKPAKKLPLFFLLSDTLQWRSLSDPEVPGTDLFNWPLPPNLFRHRFAQQLARNGVDTEVIDGWMGHAERGVATYGDQSARCWLSDYQTYEPTINDVFDRLGFRLPKTRAPLPPIGESPATLSNAHQEPQLFGVEKRRRNRLASLARAQRGANSDLDLFAGGRALEELDEHQIQSMSNLMLLRENGLPHPQAAIRYAVMMERLDTLSHLNVQPIRRRMLTIEAEYSLLTDRSPLALAIMPKLRKWVQQTKSAIDKANVSKSDALILAVTFLAVDKHLASLSLLEDIARGMHYRLIQNKKKLYLEYNEDLDQESFFQPVQRHEIDYKTATLLSYGQGIKSKVDLNKPISRRLQSLLDILLQTSSSSRPNRQPGTTLWLLEELTTFINQINLVQLPGVVSAALSGRQPPTSCSLADYFRLSDGITYQPPASQEPGPLSPDAQAPAHLVLQIEKADEGPLYANAKAFFEGIRGLLNHYTKRTARETADNIERFSSKSKTEVSSAVLYVGYWLADRIRQGKGRRGNTYDPFATSSPQRYLSALSEAFQGLAYHVDLNALDEEDITSLCSDMITLKRSNLQEVDYFGARLQEFFRWARKLGIAEPIWEDLDLGGKRRSVRPGLFSEIEYQKCLHTILNDSSSPPDQVQFAGFVLILAFRFGLRAQEAIGLQRVDWRESGDLTWILVRKNEYRELKRPSSRRAVPLMFPLSAQEKSTIEFVLRRHDSFAEHTPKAPILCAIVNSKLNITPLGRNHIPNAISQALKKTTGNPLMTLHHARHSFCNILAQVLFGFETPLTRKLTGHLEPDRIRHIILGQNTTSSRRSAMAVARAMGHSTSNTGFKSYNRMVTEWADALTPVSNSRVRKIHNAVQIQEWAVQEKPAGDSGLPLLPKRVPTPGNIVQALRLKSLGSHYDRTEVALQLCPGSLDSLNSLIERVNCRHRFKVFNFNKQKTVHEYGGKHPGLLLEKIRPEAWIRLIDQADSFPLLEDLEQAFALPYLEDVPALVGRNGHLLMSTVRHFNLIKLVLELFQLPRGSYGVFARYNDPQVTELLTQQNFRVSPITETDTGEKPQLDTFSFDQKNSRKLEQKYGGVIFSTGLAGCIHNRHELVIALVITATSYCSRKPEKVDV